MALGAGNQGAGSTFAGAGVVPTSTAASGGPFLDPITSRQQTGRLIDPTTGQYVFETTGNTAGMSTAQQLVELAIGDVDFSRIDVVTANMPAEVATRIQAALQPVVNQGVIQILSILVTPLKNVSGQSSGARGQITWRDLTTQSDPQVTPF